VVIFNVKDHDHPLFSISVVAQMLEVHPQTLRLYEREGLIHPSRTKGKTRLYSQMDLDRLKMILHFTQDLGINLAGVGLLLEIQERMSEMQGEMWRTLEDWLKSLEEGERPGQSQHTPLSPPKSTPPKTIKVKIEEA